MGSVKLTPEGQVLISTPPDPRTVESIKIFDPLDWIHAIASQIPDPRQHTTIYFGAYANHSRSVHRRCNNEISSAPALTDHPDDTESSFTKTRRKNWAHILRKILAIDPMIGPRCGAAMKVVSVITDSRVIDKILAHLKSGKGHDPFEARAPPDTLARTG